MDHKPRSLRRCKCAKCGEIEMRAGCSTGFICTTCKPRTPQELAHMAVARAIRNRKLGRPSLFACVDCGSNAEHYDHRDYSKPLDVVPVCRSCNVRRGPAIGSRAYESA